jgi:hypothetical protein
MKAKVDNPQEYKSKDYSYDADIAIAWLRAESFDEFEHMKNINSSNIVKSERKARKIPR